MDNLNLGSNDVLKSLFLLLLAASSNFIGETLSCQSRKFFSESIIGKQLILITILYFTLTFVSDKERNIHPTTNILYTFVIYLLYLAFTKMELLFTILALLVLAILYLISNFEEYYKQNNTDDKHKKTIENLETNYNLLMISLIIIVLFGFFSYLWKQYNEKDNFNFFKFLFGTVKCDNI